MEQAHFGTGNNTIAFWMEGECDNFGGHRFYLQKLHEVFEDIMVALIRNFLACYYSFC